MIGILNIAGHQRKLLSLTTSYSKTVCKKGYPNSLPIAHFFKISFLTEEGDDFFADWMYGRNKNYPSLKGQWYNGTIIFYDETSYGQEFLQYELTAALATNFRVDYDQEKGMVTTLEIFARERVYDHKFIINSEYYAITFDYMKPKEKGQQLLNDKFTLLVTKMDGKTEAKPNEKITYRVTQFNREATDNDKKHINWLVKIDGKEELQKTKGEFFELNIKEEWSEKEIFVYAYLRKPSEKVSVKTTISPFKKGYFVYIMLRSYAPFKTFGPPSNNWHGDNRGNSLDLNASYRTRAVIRYNPLSKTTMARGGVSYSHKENSKEGAYSPTYVSNKSKNNYINVSSRGGNKAQVGAPDINQFAKIVIDVEGKIGEEHILSIKGTINGDDFPNHEYLLYDEKENVICLGLYATKGDRTWGPALNLWLENEEDILARINIKVKVNAMGIFQKILNHGKEISIT